MTYRFEDFTEDQYRLAVQAAKKKWTFSSYENFSSPGMRALWRHDIDFSVERAVRLAEIEAEEGVSATYFVHLHSHTYHPWERETCQQLYRIHELGHTLGLHFEPEFYSLRFGDMEQLEQALSFEKAWMMGVFGQEVKAFSFHNPDIGGWHQLDVLEVAGMINTYAQEIREKYAYCSDSNGYWRHDRLQDFLVQDHKNIQVLTHPVWWVPTPMSPRDRIGSVIDEKAARSHASYDALLSKFERVNVS